MNFAPLAVERKVGHNLGVTLVGGLQVVLDQTPADHQETVIHFNAPAGRYDFTFRRAQATDAAIVETLVDGVIVNTRDSYANPGGTIETFTVSDVALASGDHSIVFRVNGKNAASTDYSVYTAWTDVVQR